MISLLVLSIGLLGLAKIQLTALNALSNAYFTTQAMQRLQSVKTLLSLHSENSMQLLSQWQAINQELLPASDFTQTGQQLKLTWHDPFRKQQQSLKLKI